MDASQDRVRDEPGHLEQEQCVRVAVCSPEAIIAAGMTSLLARHPHVLVMSSWDDGDEERGPDVLVYDVLGLLRDPSELPRLARGASYRVLVLDRDLRPDLTTQALSLGAAGFVSAGVDAASLLAAVEYLASRQPAAAAAAAGDGPVAGIDRAVARSRRLGAEAGLSTRELEVLTLLTQGLTNQQIADQLYLSINSVKTYLRTGYRKIGATTRAHAVVWALQHGFDPHPTERPASQPNVRPSVRAPGRAPGRSVNRSVPRAEAHHGLASSIWS